MKTALFVAGFLIVAGGSQAETTPVDPNVYRVTEGVEFAIGNGGASSYLFTWSDSGGNFTSVADPTLLLNAGQTYVFRRTSASHPFVITDASLPVTGSDGSFSRTTTSGAVIDAATLTPLGDFTADPAPTTDAITWTPQIADLGDYFYTCRVTFHTGMTGKITVEQVSVGSSKSTWSRVKALY